MRAVVQYVSDAQVVIENKVTGSIERGLLVYLGIGKSDTESDTRYLAEKIASLRILPDSDGKMNRSVTDEELPVLVVSQFTLYADARKGRRPSYNQSALPDTAEKFYRLFIELLESTGLSVATGQFGAHMIVESHNVGPVTILLDSEKSL